LQIEAVTRRILWIKATNHNSKVLVFSSWNDVLDVLEHAFATNNITFVRMKGGRYIIIYGIALSYFMLDNRA
jgi:E3 ubiquitin-protein ligase SHPRH